MHIPKNVFNIIFCGAKIQIIVDITIKGPNDIYLSSFFLIALIIKTTIETIAAITNDNNEICKI